MNKRIALAPRYAMRVEDLAQNYLLRVSCHFCGYTGTVSGAALIARYPGYIRIITIESKLRCRACLGRGYVVWHVEEAPQHH